MTMLENEDKGKDKEPGAERANIKSEIKEAADGITYGASGGSVKRELSEMRAVAHENSALHRMAYELDRLLLISEKSGGGYDARIAHLRRKIEMRIGELTSRYERIYDYISGTDDPFLRAALIQRFLYGRTWQKAAFALGEYDEQYVRKRCERYIRENGFGGGDAR